MDQPGELTQNDFAELIGVSGPYIGRHELMRTPPSRNTRLLANSIELRFGVAADWILDGVEPDAIPAQKYTAGDLNPEPTDSVKKMQVSEVTDMHQFARRRNARKQVSPNPRPLVRSLTASKIKRLS